MNKEKAETLLENYQALSELYSNIRKELERTRKALEQSETCCTEWEKQALDYKAENIGLQSKLDIAVAFIKELDGTRSGVRENLHAYNGKTLNAGNGFCWATIDQIHNILRQINQKE